MFEDSDSEMLYQNAMDAYEGGDDLNMRSDNLKEASGRALPWLRASSGFRC